MRYQVDNGIITLIPEGIKFAYCGNKDLLEHTLRCIEEQFICGNCDWLEVKGKDVLQIGAFMGDSAILFASKGARKVIALEPTPSHYRACRLNIELNGMSDNITLLNAAVGPPGPIWVKDCPDFFNGGAMLKDMQDAEGVKIRCYSLKELCDLYELYDAVMEIDCEGAEYDFFEIADTATIRRFSQIFMEFHKGNQPIQDWIQRAGFEVREAHSGENPNIGFLWAKRV